MHRLYFYVRRCQAIDNTSEDSLLLHIATSEDRQHKIMWWLEVGKKSAILWVGSAFFG